MSQHKPIGPEAVLEKKGRYLIPCTYHFYRRPPQMVRGQGVHLYDSAGKEYVDLYSGVSVHALGHCHPEITETICRQVRTLQHTTTIYLTEPIVNLAEKLAGVLDKYDMLLIADEVQTGFGRTGEMFAMQHWDVKPDILTGGKALGGGTPIGFFSTTDEIAACYTRPGASTFGGNPVTAQAALKFLEIIERDELVRRAADRGHLLKQKLEGISQEYGLIADIRGAGLMVGAELADWNNVPAAELTDTILERMKDAGYLLGKTGPGRNVLTFMPPLIIAEDDINKAVDALEKVLGNI